MMNADYYTGLCVGILKVNVPKRLNLARAQLAYCEMLKAVLTSEDKTVDSGMIDIGTLRSLCDLPALHRMWSTDWVFIHSINLYRDKLPYVDDNALNDFARKHMKSVGLYMSTDAFIRKCIEVYANTYEPTSWMRLTSECCQ